MEVKTIEDLLGLEKNRFHHKKNAVVRNEMEFDGYELFDVMEDVIYESSFSAKAEIESMDTVKRSFISVDHVVPTETNMDVESLCDESADNIEKCTKEKEFDPSMISLEEESVEIKNNCAPSSVEDSYFSDLIKTLEDQLRLVEEKLAMKDEVLDSKNEIIKKFQRVIKTEQDKINELESRITDDEKRTQGKKTDRLTKKPLDGIMNLLKNLDLVEDKKYKYYDSRTKKK